MTPGRVGVGCQKVASALLSRSERGGRRGVLFVLVLLSLLQAPALLMAQGDLPDFSVEWRWADFDRESGYGGGRVLKMMEAGDTLWVLSDGGVFWFDHFSWHRMAGGEGLPEDHLNFLALGRDGSILVVAGGQLFQGSTEGFQRRTLQGIGEGEFGIRHVADSPWGLVVSAEETATRRNALFRCTGDRCREDAIPGGTSRTLDLWQTRSGTSWLGVDEGLFRLQDGRWLAQAGQGSGLHRYSAVWEGNGGVAFAAQDVPVSTRGLFTWDPAGEPQRLPGAGEYSVLAGSAGPDETTFVLYDSGDLRLRTMGGWVVPNLPPHRSEGLNFVYQDVRGDIWLATRRGLHLFRLSLERWTELRFPFPDPRNRVNDLLLAENGDLWMATHGGLARIDSDGDRHWVREILGQGIGAVTGVAQDAEGGIWVSSGATFHGVFRYFGGSWSYLGPEEGMTGGQVHRIYPEEDGSVWFSALGSEEDPESAGVYRWSGGTVERWMDESEWLRGRSYALARGPDGALWFGQGRGLVRFKEGEWTYWNREDGLGGGQVSRVFTLLPTEDGGVYLGFGPRVGGGIEEVRPDGSIHAVGPLGYRQGVGVSEIARDPSGVVWATSDRGLLRVADGIWSTIDGTTGMDPEAAWPLEFRGGEVLLGTTGGGVRILHRGEEGDPPPRVEVLGPVLVEGQSFRLRWRAYGWRGQLPPEFIEVRDQLPGQDWSDWHTFRELWTSEDDDFGTGEKTVRIQAKGLYGKLSEPLEVRFEIPRPLHLRPLFYGPVALLVGVILALVVGGVVRRRRTERAIREREGRLRTLVDTAPDGIAIYDADADRFIDVNTNVLQMTKMTREEFLATRLGGSSPELAPDGRLARDVLQERVEEALGGKTVTFEWTSRAEDGTRIPTLMHLVRFPSSTGRLVRFSVLDISEQKEGERKQKELEAQLRQSQKLEAVGQLTGGVAHDFNNLLTVIMGNLDLLRETQEDPEVQDLLDGALGAAERSALLTQRLLAFSRRQALDSRPIVLRELVEGILGLLKRSLGETIKIRSTFPEDLWVIQVDPGQLEHAIINLAVNARDAMPKGGDLFLEANNVSVETEVAEKWGGREGEYVCFSVTDTGVGMEPGVRERAIDPFFTTKEVGEGSGLGLSMVYGFLQQSGGFIKIYSELGSGTAVQLFLPRAEGDDVQAERLNGDVQEVSPGEGETILVVEDEPLLLALSTRLCERLGYEVFPAKDAEMALDYLEAGSNVDLLFSDVVLPGEMDGIQLALRAREIRPGLPVLFTSGYAEQSVLRIAQGLSDFQLVPKPFDSGTLARRIRAVLGEAP